MNDSASQCRNFFDPGDQDWVTFYGVSGQTYKVEAGDLGPKNNVVIEVYDTDGTTLLAESDYVGDPRADESLEWQCIADGLYFVKIRPADIDIAGEGTNYRLEIYRAVADLFGYIGGTIKDGHTGEPIENASAKTNVGASGASKDGTYFMVHRVGTSFLLTVNAIGYSEKTIADVSVSEDQTTLINIELEPLFVDTEPTVLILSPATDVTINEGESVNFQSSVTNGNEPFLYVWDFDGGAANAMLEDPGDVTFESQGAYTVHVTVTDVDGDSDRASVEVTVNEVLMDTEPMLAIVCPTSNVTIVEGTSVNFQASLLGGNAPFSYVWDFDGGATNVTVEDPGDVMFATQGTYTVSVTVTDVDGDTDSAVVTITVNEVAIDTQPIVSIVSPAANVSINAGESVNFQGTVSGGEAPLSYAWNFNGGATNATSEDPGNVAFMNPGTFTVVFTVVDFDGDADSASIQVTVTAVNNPGEQGDDGDGGGGGGGCFVQAINSHAKK